ncbi:MAG: 2-C-methyl-D-erythritol 2,4-cyclodiphosphate synthase, partial [Chthonomonadaceae bacterium]|nr:2-C-methyl-D-erythritol 2,4-cyclodiphosphate synthase [Chthonomonadaceae bacterium]
GRSVLERTLTAFDSHPALTAIVMVAEVEELERVRQVAAAFPKVIAVVAGGETRSESVRNGLDALPPEIEIVLVHDAARPLVTAALIDSVIAASARVGAAVPGLPLSDTVKRVDADGLVHATIPRTAVVNGVTLSGLTSVQTPQGARVTLLRNAYAEYDTARYGEPTDEASLIEATGGPVAVVAGDPANMKITRPEDIALAERLLATPVSQNMAVTSAGAGEIRTGLGYDVHQFAEPEAGRTLMIGGIEIEHDRGLNGHSDADVLLHAVCDALLGAASLGDIGILFPNTDDTYRGISSLRLLAIVGERLVQSGWQIVNIDATIVAEAPKLMPHRAKMQQAMAACLGLEATRLSVKATTSEKMGFVGRKEGMACWCIATIRTL